MPLTSHMINSFFQDDDKMGLSARTQDQLAVKGITNLDDLADFDIKEAWAKVVEICKRPPKIADPNNTNQLIAQETFQLPAKSLMHLMVDAKEVKYFNSIDRLLTANIMTWDRFRYVHGQRTIDTVVVLNCFCIHLKAHQRFCW